MWLWFWKWETLALPIWRLELITNKIKQNYLKQRDLAPLRRQFIPFQLAWCQMSPKENQPVVWGKFNWRRKKNWFAMNGNVQALSLVFNSDASISNLRRLRSALLISTYCSNQPTRKLLRLRMPFMLMLAQLEKTRLKKIALASVWVTTHRILIGLKLMIPKALPKHVE